MAPQRGIHTSGRGFGEARSLLRRPCAPLSRHLPRPQCKAEGNTLLEKFKSTSVPHFLFFRDGHLRDTVVGPNVPQLERALREHVPKAGDPVVDPTVRQALYLHRLCDKA